MQYKLIIALFAVFTFVACSDDTKNNSNNSIYKKDVNNGDGSDPKSDMDDTGNSDMGTDIGSDTRHDMEGDSGADTGEEDSGSDSGEDTGTCEPADCASGEGCVNDACRITDACAAAKDLGALTDGMAPIKEEGSFLDEGADTIATTCGNAGIERVFSFTLANPETVKYSAKWTGQFDGVVAFRTSCANDATEGECVDNEVGEIDLPAGTHFIILEVKFGNPGDYELELSVGTQSGCTPGERMCENANTLKICGGTTFQSYACGGACANANCNGNTCAAPIDIPGQGGHFTGSTVITTDDYAFKNSTTCTLDTTGYDVVYSLGHLVAGKTITIQTDVFSPIFIIKGANNCANVNACIQMFQTNDEVTYTIPNGGEDDYFIIVDTIGLQPSPYTHRIEILNR